MTVKDIIEEYYHSVEEVVIFDNPSYDEAFIGLSHDDRAIYDYDKMVHCLMDEGMSMEEAADFISYNTIRALSYCPNGPIVLFAIEEGI